MLNLFDEIEGVEILKKDTGIRSTDQISLHEYGELKQWDFDYISFLDGEDGDIASDLDN